jgi:hypothetical protein
MAVSNTCDRLRRSQNTVKIVIVGCFLLGSIFHSLGSSTSIAPDDA